MYAIIVTGGQQFRVEPGMRLSVPRLDGAEGSSISFDKVLLIGGDGEGELRIGTPTLEKALVEAQVVRQMRGPKLEIFHRKRRKGYEKKTGHRQELTEIRITGITGS
jgi:large subunit ribosomal protein L21